MTAETTTTPSPETTVAGHKEWLVTTGDELGRLAGNNKDWKSQVGVLGEAARTETEPKVMLNLLRYQAARNSTPWKGVHEDMAGAFQECQEKAGSDTELAMELIRLLLVYARRSYTWHEHLRKNKNKTNDHGEEE